MNPQEEMDPQTERIIRSEAKEFTDHELDWHGNGSPVLRTNKLRSRLRDYYRPEYKAIFLDEIESTLKKDLQDHRDKKHGGKPDPNCHQEKDTETILFYVEQELSVLPTVAHQRATKKSEFVRTKVFVSYSRRDKKYLDEVERHFKPFLKDIDVWTDTRIEPGKKWKDEIRQAINETKVAILLVSTNFLGSDFITTDELPPLLEAAEKEGTVILNVIVEPCLFEDFPTLNVFQTMNNPNNPIVGMEYVERENLYVNLVRQVKRVLNGQAG